MKTGDKWIRARTSEQIEQRIRTILDAAGTVFRTVPYEEVTMLKIAREAGFSRSNLYRYFATREEIFLVLLLSDVAVWSDHIRRVFVREVTLETFVTQWTDILCRHARLLGLVPLLALSLEKNTSEEVYRQTKLSFDGLVKELIPILRIAMPSIGIEQWREFLVTHLALMAGAWPMTQYTAMQLKVLDELSLNGMKIDFAVFYRKTMLMYLRGVCGNGETCCG